MALSRGAPWDLSSHPRRGDHSFRRPNMAARTLCVAAHALEIAPFLTSEDLQHVQQTSWLLWVSYERRACLPDRARRAQQVASLVRHQEALVRYLRSVLQTVSSTTRGKGKRSKSASARFRDDQLLPLLRDLVLVGIGVRPSCLVDTCQLGQDSVDAMIAAFAVGEHWRAFDLECLSAVQFAGNVFFVNTSEFVRLKCQDAIAGLRNVTLVNASGDLKGPQVITHTATMGVNIRRGLLDSLKSLVDYVLEQSKSLSLNRRTIDFKPHKVCSTAMAGLVLCYPVVYHIGATSSVEAHDPFWSTTENCLGHCPLHLFQTSLTLDHKLGEPRSEVTRLLLQEFSLPQHFHCDGDSDQTRVAPQTIATQCRRALEDIIGGVDGLSIHVQVSARTLPHVAL